MCSALHLKFLSDKPGHSEDLGLQAQVQAPDPNEARREQIEPPNKLNQQNGRLSSVVQALGNNVGGGEDNVDNNMYIDLNNRPRRAHSATSSNQVDF